MSVIQLLYGSNLVEIPLPRLLEHVNLEPNEA